jgi:hypothetical protein
MLLEGSLRREIIQDDIAGNLRQCVGYRTDTDWQACSFVSSASAAAVQAAIAHG